MIPDATAIAAGATLVNAGYAAYPVFGAVLGIVMVVWGGKYVTRSIKGLFGK